VHGKRALIRHALVIVTWRSAAQATQPRLSRLKRSDIIVMNEELRTYGLGAAVVLLLGVGAGFGLHHFVDGPKAKAAAAVVAKDVPDPTVSCPPSQRAGPPINDTSGDAPLSETLHPPQRKPHTSKTARVR
jgi:hypothetical protein